MTGTSGGLGRGLAAILTATPEAPALDQLRDRFIDSALSSLDGPQPLRYCGHVHDDHGVASVTLRHPLLGAIDATTAYRLFTGVGAASAAGQGRHRFDLGEVTCYVVIRRIEGRRSLFFFGDPALDASDIERLSAFAKIYAPVILEHDIEAREDEQVRLVLDQQGDTVRAEIEVGGDVGTGTAKRPHQAAATAALAACTPEARLVEVREVRADDGVACFVVVAGDSGRIAMSAAPVTAGPDVAAAVAALRAARTLGH